MSISNFEHDGLGRYGDPIDPNGDMRAMSEMQALVKPNGFLILGVPVARDAVVWNAHRLYGRVRLPLLLRGWSIDAFVGFDGQVRVSTVCQLHRLHMRGVSSFFGRLWVVWMVPLAGVTTACMRSEAQALT